MCNNCKGTGRCPQCRGSGIRNYKGFGKIKKDKCVFCRGTGVCRKCHGK